MGCNGTTLAIIDMFCSRGQPIPSRNGTKATKKYAHQASKSWVRESKFLIHLVPGVVAWFRIQRGDSVPVTVTSYISLILSYSRLQMLFRKYNRFYCKHFCLRICLVCLTTQKIIGTSFQGTMITLRVWNLSDSERLTPGTKCWN